MLCGLHSFISETESERNRGLNSIIAYSKQYPCTMITLHRFVCTCSVNVNINHGIYSCSFQRHTQYEWHVHVSACNLKHVRYARKQQILNKQQNKRQKNKEKG